ncbi:MAG TPA: GNAT family N-acetyltransferase [Candidatus Acidoferrales bacterium]
MRTRKARIADIPAIQNLIEHYAAQGTLLPRSEEDICRHLSGFLVAVEDAAIIGCVSLEWYSSALAEIRSLAVNPAIRGRGIGTRLMKAALELAEKRKIGRIIALTSSPEFFIRQGFALSNRFALHEKIDRDCVHCWKSQTCRLSAVVMNVSEVNAALDILSVASETVQTE